MNLVSMKSSKKKIQETCKPSPVDAHSYPYGLTITLHEESINKLGIKLEDFSVGGPITLAALGKIKELSESSSEYSSGEKNERKTMVIQITDMAIKNPKTYEDAFKEAVESNDNK